MHLQEDALVLRDLGVDAYRFSIPWTRILPNGTLSGGINQEGIDHYNTLIDELIKIGVKPFVTLLHFDLPQALQDKYGTYLNRSIVEDFKAYGDRVKHWITINEPFIVAKYGYTAGNAPPGRCSDRRECAFGNSATEPYIAIHNLLLAHETAARLYKDIYQVTIMPQNFIGWNMNFGFLKWLNLGQQAEQGGVIGMSNVAQYYEPYSYTLADRKAARRAMEFDLGWSVKPHLFSIQQFILKNPKPMDTICVIFSRFMEPLVRGQYPPIMQKLVKDRLPVFTEEDKELIKGSFDFIGLNYYTSRYSKNIPTYPRGAPLSLFTDPRVNITAKKNGVLIGPKAEGSGILYIYPRGLYKILNFVKKHYGEGIDIYISENGVSQKRNDIIPINQVLSDEHKLNMFRNICNKSARQLRKIADNSTLDVSIDSYKRYKEDALVLRDLGVDAYRFSIPWTRILPNGTLSGGINQEGIDHYNTLIDELIKIGVKPFVTLLHFDLPQALEDKYGTYLNRSIVEDFKNYAEICFKAYGDRVKHWITINEPFIVAKYGYTAGNAPPGRCSDRRECAFGNSATEPYIAIHNLLLAHATAARLYKDKYQAEQGGVIGMSNVAQYYEPYSYTLADRKAARRAMEFDLGCNGVNVKGYFYWSLFDDFEWGQGYETQYGLYYIDFNDNLKRIPRKSARWYQDFIKGDKK
ncbi:hypothetical protein GQ457_11G028530 [Hibiscus cannabinus]